VVAMGCGVGRVLFGRGPAGGFSLGGEALAALVAVALCEHGPQLAGVQPGSFGAGGPDLVHLTGAEMADLDADGDAGTAMPA
jgi:hypothetical protein